LLALGSDSVDVVVVGSGLAGATYARVLSELAPGASIAIIESGPRLSAKSGLHMRNLTDPQERDSALLLAQGPDPRTHTSTSTYLPPASATGSSGVTERPGLYRVSLLTKEPDRSEMPSAALTNCVGGMGVLWRGACPRPLGSEISPLLPQSELDECIEKAYSLLGISPSGIASSVLDEICAFLGRQMDVGVPESSLIRQLPLAASTSDGRVIWGGTDVLLGDILERPDSNVSLHARTRCRSVLLDKDQATGVELLDLDTRELSQLRAKYVVLAANAFCTPQILYASAIRPNALGRYLNDHLKVTAQAKLSRPLLEAAVRAQEPSTLERGGCWIPFAGDARPYHGQAILSSHADIAGDGGHPVTAGISVFASKNISKADRILFSSTTEDTFGMPAMDVRYSWTAEDHRTLEMLTSAAREIGGHLGVSGVERVNILPPGASLHYLGTTRMGEEEADCVCDSYGRVYGISNLYVGGGSLIETATACNPALTIIALACRGAKQMAAEIGAQSANT
jgi:choline dehydrogenase-like flavoprotein